MLNAFYAALGIFGISILLTDYDGPKNIISKVRSKLGFTCAVCLGFWISIIVALVLGLSLGEFLASLGVAIILLRNA